MVVHPAGYQKIRNGMGYRFYVARLWTSKSGIRYSLKRFPSAEMAEQYGARLTLRYRMLSGTKEVERV